MKKRAGFTLIELLTVVVIIGILTAIALPQYRRSIQRAEAANALINLKTLFDASKRYYSTHSSWPSSFTGLDVKFLDQGTAGEVGEFQYGFGTQTATACRLVEGSASGTYCLTANYRLNDVRDVYTCSYSTGKYQALCESLCATDQVGQNPCIIK